MSYRKLTISQIPNSGALSLCALLKGMRRSSPGLKGCVVCMKMPANPLSILDHQGISDIRSTSDRT